MFEGGQCRSTTAVANRVENAANIRNLVNSFSSVLRGLSKKVQPTCQPAVELLYYVYVDSLDTIGLYSRINICPRS